MDQLTEELKRADAERKRRFGSRQTATSRQGGQGGQTTNQARALANVRFLREALKNPDLPAHGKAVMLKSLRHSLRVAEGKPAGAMGEETMTGRVMR